MSDHIFWMTFIHKLIYTLVCLSLFVFIFFLTSRVFFLTLPKFSQLVKNVFKMAKSPFNLGFLVANFLEFFLNRQISVLDSRMVAKSVKDA